MRKITQHVVGAFNQRKAARSGNTVSTGSELLLHGNLIAQRRGDGFVYITDAGWPTVTTKERLNGISGVQVNQSKGQWYLNGKPWKPGPVSQFSSKVLAREWTKAS